MHFPHEGRDRALLDAILGVLRPDLIGLMIVGLVGGILAGALPGITATMSVATLLPFTFALPPAEGLLLLASVYFGAIYGGSISAILLGIPGTPAAAATVLDGHAMARAGKASKALAIAALASGIGGLVSVLALVTVAPLLARVALQFDAPEYLGVAFLGLSVISSVSGKSFVKGFMAGLLGLLLATVGLDPVTAVPRLTLGLPQLLNGVSVIPVLVGLFAVSDILDLVTQRTARSSGVLSIQRGEGLRPQEFFRLLPTMLRSALTGVIIGAIPATGADVAAFIAYDQAKRLARDPDSFGQGNPHGVAAAESANNGTTGATFIPLLTLGIPGDAVTAIVLGGLLVHGVLPGPLLFQQNAALIHTLFTGMALANLLVIVLGVTASRFFAWATRISPHVLVAVVAVLSAVGAYGVNNSIFDVGIAMLFGGIGLLMKRASVPLAPVILGLILGPLAETNFRRSLLLYGGYQFLWTRPLGTTLLVVALFLTIWPVVREWRSRVKPTTASSTSGAHHGTLDTR